MNSEITAASITSSLVPLSFIGHGSGAVNTCTANHMHSLPNTRYPEAATASANGRLGGACRGPPQTRSIVTSSSTISFLGLSCGPRATLAILSAISWPSTTSPKMV